MGQTLSKVFFPSITHQIYHLTTWRKTSFESESNLIFSSNSRLLRWCVYAGNTCENVQTCWKDWTRYEFTFIRGSRPELYCLKGVLKNFVRFKGKHLCQSLFFNKVAGRGRDKISNKIYLNGTLKIKMSNWYYLTHFEGERRGVAEGRGGEEGYEFRNVLLVLL